MAIIINIQLISYPVVLVGLFLLYYRLLPYLLESQWVPEIPQVLDHPFLPADPLNLFLRHLLCNL